jgi:hypothetical protein
MISRSARARIRCDDRRTGLAEYPEPEVIAGLQKGSFGLLGLISRGKTVTPPTTI